MSPEERRNSLNLTDKSRQILSEMTMSEEIANNLIENQISEFELPIGLAQNFVVNDKKYLVPMATEEPSVIAAASNGAKIAGEFTSNLTERLMRGQIVFYDVKNAAEITKKIRENEAEIFDKAEQSYPSIVKRGGGLRKFDSREFDGNFLSVDFQIDVCDAMGANIVNSILEGISELFRTWFSDENILFSILSNFATESLVTATCEIPFEKLSKTNNGKEIAEKIVKASQFSKLDIYRATTHNKGIMNGVEAVILATGNDTRAINSAVHAFAAVNGTYRGLADWEISGSNLTGKITLPLPVATVGAGVKVLPKAQIMLDILQITEATELAKIIAAVGLAQNLAALRALVSEGIQKGHMSLQARSLALTVGAKGPEIDQLTEKLRSSDLMNQEIALSYLTEIRNQA